MLSARSFQRVEAWTVLRTNTLCVPYPCYMFGLTLFLAIPVGFLEENKIHKRFSENYSFTCTCLHLCMPVYVHLAIINISYFCAYSSCLVRVLFKHIQVCKKMYFKHIQNNIVLFCSKSTEFNRRKISPD